MADLEHNEQHADDALAKLAEQFKDKENLAKVLNALNVQTQALEDAFWQLYLYRWVNTAEGVQLDTIGNLVGQPRSGDDDEYRARIKARIRANVSNGTTEDIYAVFKALMPTAQLRLQNSYPGTFTFGVGGAVPEALVDVYIGFLNASISAGTRAIFEYLLGEVSATLYTDLNTVLDGAHSIGGAVLTVTDTSRFPASGELEIQPYSGASLLETITYSSKTDTTFVLATTLTKDHGTGSCVRLSSGGLGLGLGDETDPDVGGELAGAVDA